jgi:hypothetical protein
VGRHDAVAHGRRGGDQVEVVLALEALLDDLGVEEAEETAAEAEAERAARLGLVRERRVVQLQLLERVLQVGVGVGVDGIETREDHRLHVLEARQRLEGRLARIGERVADPHLRERLDARDDHAHLASGELIDAARVRIEHVDGLDLALGAHGHHQDPLSRSDLPVDHAHEHHRAHVRIEPGVEHERARRRIGVP